MTDLEYTRKILGEKTAFVVGLGGLGGFVAEILARSGVGKLVICDGDVFSESNLNRQIFCTRHNIGKSKANEARLRLEAVADCEVVAVPFFVDEGNVFEYGRGADIVLDCSDNVKVRFVLEKFAATQKIPLVHGAVSGLVGQVAVILGEKACADVQAESVLGQIYATYQHTRHTLAPIPAAVAAFQANEAIKLLCGIGETLDGKLLCVDMLDNDISVLDVSDDKDI